MDTEKLAGIAILIFAFIIGCSGTYANIETQSQSDSKVTLQELDDNWSEYEIWFKFTVIVFDPKNDDNKILVGSSWGSVKNQEAWTEIIEENTTSDGDLSPRWAKYAMTGVREIWGPNKQFYGYIVHQLRDLVSAMVVDENTVRIYHHTARYGGP